MTSVLCKNCGTETRCSNSMFCDACELTRLRAENAKLRDAGKELANIVEYQIATTPGLTVMGRRGRAVAEWREATK